MEKIRCNPLNLSYAFQEVKEGKGFTVAREAADPTLILFKDTYYLFPSVSGGFWYSDDLADWTFIETPDWPIYDYAPDVREVNGCLYFSASGFQKGAIYRTPDPIHEPLQEVSRPFKMWDPNIFEDDDGRVFFYWGCSNKTPIWGIELDPHSMLPIGEKRDLIYADPAQHGWERPGVNNDPTASVNAKEKLMRIFMGSTPYIEGAYMNKYNGRYYLQYAAPGTELDGYGDGVYVGSTPLGPFVYQQSNPFSHKPGGFIRAAGHGSTFQDKHGNWWHIASMKISRKFNFERRLGLFPAGFDEDGVLFCNQNFADWPMVIPDGKIDPWKTTPDWMLLSYGKGVSVSSEIIKGSGACLTDEDIKTAWTAASSEQGEWAMVDLGRQMDVRAVQVNFYEADDIQVTRKSSDIHGAFPKRHISVNEGPLRYLLEGSADGKIWKTLEDKRHTDTDLPHDFLTFPNGISLRYVRVTGYGMPYDARLCMSAIRVFGHGGGEKPAQVIGKVERSGDVSVRLTWDEVDGAVGYNIRYGTSPDKLYHSWLVYGQNELRMNCLNAGQAYYFVIDSFNENGVTEGVVSSQKENNRRDRS